MKKILVLEDEKNTNEVICEYLKDGGYLPFPCFDGNKALEIFDQEDIDLCILDIMVPGIDGMNVLKEIRKESQIPVIMLTAINDEFTQISSYDAKVDEYVAKPFSPRILIKKVEALLRRCDAVENLVITYKDLIIDFSSYQVTKDKVELHLTTREFDILKLLVSNNNHVVTREMILDHLWKDDLEASDRLIDTHIKNLRKKLDCDLIETVKGVGYVVRLEQ